MIHKIIYIFAAITIVYGCAGSLDFDSDRFYASTDYAVPETDEITLRGIESSMQISVSSNCTWTFSTDSDWLSLLGDDESGTLFISAFENPTDDPRVGVINIYNDTQLISSVTVTQQAAERPLVTNGSESANCYIVSHRGTYKFPAFKGNSTSSVGDVSSVEVLWESFGTSVKPAVGDLISQVSYFDGEIVFSTPSEFKEGNALIAAKDAAGNILWSWHIWLTDQPQGQVYYNNAGTMMDRNLGATSATPGEVETLGLLYQWGRKDPFLGASTITHNSPIAESTLDWPFPEGSTSTIGTIEYSIAHPTTFIGKCAAEYDWYYVPDRNSETDNTRWTTSDKEKSIYDPCPAGWRVPDVDVYATASGENSVYISGNGGVNFSKVFGPDETIWYPCPGVIIPYYSDYFTIGGLYLVDTYGSYWSASCDYSSPSYAYCLHINDNDKKVNTTDDTFRAEGLAVRCIEESHVSMSPTSPLDIDKVFIAYLKKSGGFTDSDFNVTALNDKQFVVRNTKYSTSLIMTLENGRATTTDDDLRVARFISFEADITLNGYDLTFYAHYTSAAYQTGSIRHTARLDSSMIEQKVM